MEENSYNGVTENTSTEETVKDITKVLKKISVGALESDDITLPGLDATTSGKSSGVYYKTNEISNSNETSTESSKFKVCTSTAIAKPTIWSKIKSVLLTEIKVELTPYQQKIENEINEFLHKEITWKSVKAFWTQEVKITF